jgi:hypothetical protein
LRREIRGLFGAKRHQKVLTDSKQVKIAKRRAPLT